MTARERSVMRHRRRMARWARRAKKAGISWFDYAIKQWMKKEATDGPRR